MKNSKKVLMNVTLLEEFRRKNEGSYLDCFMPLVCACLVEDQSERIDNGKLYKIFSKNFVTNIPIHAFKAILKRAKQKGYLRQDDNVTTKNMELIQKTHGKFLKLSKKIDEAQKSMTESFQKFALTKYNMPVSESDFLNAFTHYMQKHFMDYLRLDIEAVNKDNQSTAEAMEYMVGVYIRDVWLGSNKSIPEFLQTNIQGFYLANYIGYFENNLHEKLKSFQVYIDTPVLMGLLGWNGKSAGIYYQGLLDALKKHKVSLNVFEDTIDEVKGVYRGYITAIRTENWKSFNNSTLRYIRNSGITVEAIEREIVTLENRLSGLGLTICEMPERIHAYQMDEETFRGNLVRVGYTDFRQNTDRDVDYVSSIHRLRQAKFIDHNSTKVPVYFTDNQLLIRTTIDFFRNDKDEENSTIPHCVSDLFLSSLLLLRNPADGLGVSKGKIIAEAFATIHTDDEFWEKIYSRVDVLAKNRELTDEEFNIYRYSTELHAYIQDQRIIENLSVDDLDADKIRDLLKNYKANLSKEKDSEIQMINSQHSDLKKDMEALKCTNKVLANDNSDLQKRTGELSSEIENTLDGRLMVKYITNIIAYLGSVMFIGLLTVVIFFDKFSGWFPNNVNEIKGGSIAVTLIVAYFGLSRKTVQSWLSNNLEDKIYQFFVSKTKTKLTESSAKAG